MIENMQCLSESSLFNLNGGFWCRSRGRMAWENGVDKWGRLKFHVIDNLIQSPRQFNSEG